MYKALPERDVLLDEIKCIVSENNGELPGIKNCAKKLGYSVKSLQVNQYWNGWNALREILGITPEKFRNDFKYSNDNLIKYLADLALEINRFPTDNDIRHASLTISGFPTTNTFDNRLGKRQSE